MTKTVIFINGPPRSGKDTAAKFITKAMSNCSEYKLSQPLKHGLREMFQLTPKAMKTFEEYKEEPGAILGDLSWRQAQIWLSEEVMKPMFGQNIFGKIGARHIHRDIIAPRIVISDCGFIDEVRAIRDYREHPSCYALILYREGCNYDNDSRDYVDFASLGIPVFAINNDHDLEMYEVQVKRALKTWNLIP